MSDEALICPACSAPMNPDDATAEHAYDQVVEVRIECQAKGCRGRLVQFISPADWAEETE